MGSLRRGLRAQRQMSALGERHNTFTRVDSHKQLVCSRMGLDTLGAWGNLEGCYCTRAGTRTRTVPNLT
jgi:hypothetical protein